MNYTKKSSKSLDIIIQQFQRCDLKLPGGTPVNIEMMNALLAVEKRMNDSFRVKFIDTATNVVTKEKEVTA